jgi:hypothetical protein
MHPTLKHSAAWTSHPWIEEQLTIKATEKPFIKETV